MGEYFYTDGPGGEQVTRCKIGTCEAMYYVRHDEAEILRPHDTGREVGYALDSSCFWRFPWPFEDAHDGHPRTVDEIAELATKREPFLYRVFRAPGFDLGEHGDKGYGNAGICQHIKSIAGAHGFNVWITCPQDPRFNLKTSRGGVGWETEGPLLGITSQKHMKDGRTYTVFACGYCDHRFGVSPEELQPIKRGLYATADLYKGKGTEREREIWTQITERVKANEKAPVPV